MARWRRPSFVPPPLSTCWAALGCSCPRCPHQAATGRSRRAGRSSHARSLRRRKPRRWSQRAFYAPRLVHSSFSLRRRGEPSMLVDHEWRRPPPVAPGRGAACHLGGHRDPLGLGPVEDGGHRGASGRDVARHRDPERRSPGELVDPAATRRARHHGDVRRSHVARRDRLGAGRHDDDDAPLAGSVLPDAGRDLHRDRGRRERVGDADGHGDLRGGHHQPGARDAGGRHGDVLHVGALEQRIALHHRGDLQRGRHLWHELRVPAAGHQQRGELRLRPGADRRAHLRHEHWAAGRRDRSGGEQLQRRDLAPERRPERPS